MTLPFPYLVCIALLFMFPTPTAANDGKPTVPVEDYGRWETLSWRHRALSNDGSWYAFYVQRVNRQNELRVRHTGEDKGHVLPMGESPAFSNNSTYLKWTVALSEAEREKRSKSKADMHTALGLLNLETGDQQEFEAVARSAFDETGRYLALLGHPTDKDNQRGADLRILDLSQGTETLIGNVASYRWSDTGSLIALVLKTGKDYGNGIQVFDSTSGSLQTLDTSASHYGDPVWREDHLDLAVMRSLDTAKHLDDNKDEHHPTYQLLAWKGLDGPSPQRLELDPEKTGVPSDLHVVAHRQPAWSKDGSMISFGLRPAHPDAEPEAADPAADADGEASQTPAKKDKPKLAGVQIWHTNDIRIFPYQQYNKRRYQNRVFLSVWYLTEQRVVRIGQELSSDTELLEGWKHATERTTTPYPWGDKFGREFHDLWIIEVTTGNRTKALEKVRYTWDGADGKRVLHYDGEHYHAYDIASGKRTPLTQDINTSFVDQEYDTPTDVMPPHGVGGWLTDDAAVLLYDKHNVWRVPLNGGKAVRLTDGDKDRIVHRILDLDPDEASIDPNADLYFSMWGEWSEKRGFARLEAGKKRAKTLVLKDMQVRNLTKAKDAERFTYTTESASDPTEIHSAGPNLKAKHRLDKLNPFRDEYAWTRSQLINYTSEEGKDLQAAFFYPANYEEGKAYPMVVYTYEKLSSWIHRFRVPDHRDYYSFAAWTQQGYAVLFPDIVYSARNPGPSAVASVRPAIQKVVEMGLVDGDKVGLAGHSWGGYQAAYLPTRTKLFAASVSGAPLTDFVSFMGQIHWRPGIAETGHWETGQGRMEVPYWEDVEAYLRSSPIHKIHEMETPVLMAHGNDDGVVEFFQSTVYYNYARRAGKQMVLLVYEDEDHSFRKKENQIDFHRRILEWFGHYLKGEPAPRWITDGIPLEELDEEKRRIADQPGPVDQPKTKEKQ